MIAIVVFTGCKAGDALIATLLWSPVAISIVVGTATFVVLFIMAMVNWRRNRKGAATPSAKE